MPEQAPRSAPQPQQPAPAPPAPGLVELFEQSLTAVVDPSVCRRAAARPAPSFGAAAGLALASGAAALAVDLAHGLVSSPALLQRFSPAVLAAVGVAGLGLYASVLLLLAVMLYGIGNGFGGKGEFERGLQAAAMISALAPVQMLCSWFPAAWIAPALLAAWVAAGALEGLFNARRGPVRALCALLAAGAIGLQFAGRALIDRTRDAYAATQAVSAANVELARSMSALAQRMPAEIDATALPRSSSPPAASGLDLLRGGPSDGDSAPEIQPLGEPAPRAPQPGTPPITAAQGGLAPEAAQAMEASAAGMLDALTPMLDMLTSSKTLRPEQRADVKELQSLMQDLKTHMASGKKMDNAAFAAKMSRYQALLMRVMASSSQAQPAAPGAPAPDGKVHLRLPKSGR